MTFFDFSCLLKIESCVFWGRLPAEDICRDLLAMYEAHQGAGLLPPKRASAFLWLVVA